MFRSSASLMAEDVTIRCRVRLSLYATNPQFDSAREVTCTMRNWESRSTSALRHGGRSSSSPRTRSSGGMSRSMNEKRSVPAFVGPELLLTPIREILSSRDESPVRRLSRLRPRSYSNDALETTENCQPMTIPVAEILTIDTKTKHLQASSPHSPSSPRNPRHIASRLTLYINTTSLGYYEFQCTNRNGHDILMAFLRASVEPERIIEGVANASQHSFHDLRSNSSVASSCMDMDMDGLHAEHLSNQQGRESWQEKVGRRLGKAITSLSELCSGAVCDYACCSNVNNNSSEIEVRDGVPLSIPPSPVSPLPPSTITPQRQQQQHLQDQMNPRGAARKVTINKQRQDIKFRYSDLELDDADSTHEMQPISSTKSTKSSRRAMFSDLEQPSQVRTMRV